MIFAGQAVPSLPQTPAYAQVIAETGLGSLPGDLAGQAVAVCAARQQHLLADADRRVSVVVGEAASRQQVGGPEVTAGQLEYLSGLAETNPAVTVQVLPFEAGAHAASGSMSFSLLRFGAAPGLEVVFVPALNGGVFVDDHREIAAYLRAFTALRAGSFPADRTALMLREAAAPWQCQLSPTRGPLRIAGAGLLLLGGLREQHTQRTASARSGPRLSHIA
jgi:hypothetical protein